MKTYIFTFLFILFLVSSASSQGIEFFHGTWKEAMAKAKEENKVMFVDAFAEWCGPCKAMAKNVFTLPEVGEYYNSNFINVKLDMEKEDGVTFGHKYPVSAYPTLYFLDGDGKVLKNVKGGQRADGLLSLGAEAIKKNDQSGKYEAKYNEGDRSYDLMLSYIKALNAAGKPSQKISNDYLLSNPSITENQKYAFMVEAVLDADSKIFDQLIENKKEVITVVGKDVFESKSETVCQNTVQKAIDFEMESLLNEAITKAKKAFPDGADIFTAKANMQFYKVYLNEEKYISAYKLLAKKSSKDSKMLSFIVKDIAKNFIDNKKMMEDALEYSEMAYNISLDNETLNTYCGLLLKNEEVEKALKVAEKAKEKAEKSGESLGFYDGLIHFINSKKA